MIAIIALLVTRLVLVEVTPNDSIAAGCGRAGIRTSIFVEGVAVVASLVTTLALCDVGSANTITAGRYLAVVAARIGLGIVTVITSFVTLLPLTKVRPSERISAPCASAVVAATVGFNLVPVVAFFAFFNLTVTAVLQRAGVRAPVSIDLVSVVARLEPRLPGFTVATRDAVAAASRLALPPTRVVFLVVSVVTNLKTIISLLKIGP